MRTLRLIILAVAGALMLACGADVAEHGTRLVIDEAQVTSEVLYMLPDVSQVPFTALELEEQGVDRSQAIPVRVEVYENTAVAWFAPDGEPRIGADWIIALWTVERVPVSDETYSEGSTETRASGSYYMAPDAIDTRLGYDIELVSAGPTAAEVAIIAFLDVLGTPDELAAIEELVTHHPGCLRE